MPVKVAPSEVDVIAISPDRGANPLLIDHLHRGRELLRLGVMTENDGRGGAEERDAHWNLL